MPTFVFATVSTDLAADSFTVNGCVVYLQTANIRSNSQQYKDFEKGISLYILLANS
jgi:hypothetical protein